MTRIAYRPKKEYLEATKTFKSIDIKLKTLENNGLLPVKSKQEEVASEKRRQRRLKGKFSKSICFGCRQKGHGIESCPEISAKKQLICYACGKSDHALKDCANYDGKQALEYAECFLCKTKGHLASTCKLNEKGMYPDGGGCRFCGLNNHLAKDCPSQLKQQQKANGETMVLDEISLDQGGDDDMYNASRRKDLTTTRAGNTTKRGKKIIKF
eukprot:Partr_v1_DN26305_c1_g1_i1_m43454 putative Zinc finger, CCHC domain containing